MFTQLSQASPTPSPSTSAWFAFDVFLQLSQESPTLSPSASAWFALAVNWQLSSQLIVCPPVHLLVPTVPSALPSSRIPSLSSSPSQASPVPSRSLSSWFTFALFTQLSQASPTPSESASAWLVLDLNWQLSSQLVVAPPVQGWSPTVPSASPSSSLPSLSSSVSQASPVPSPSVSLFVGSYASGH